MRWNTVRDVLGTPDVLVNNSGIARPASTLDVTEDDWTAVVGTNLEGAWRVARGTAQRMVDTGRPGTIVNVLSILAFRVAGGLGPYAASKAGLLQLTRTMALELARHRVRVNAIAPGYVLTEMNREYFASEAGAAATGRVPQRRIGDPSDLDGALLLLASDASLLHDRLDHRRGRGPPRVEPLSLDAPAAGAGPCPVDRLPPPGRPSRRGATRNALPRPVPPPWPSRPRAPSRLPPGARA